jgi:hypothetical protein
MTWHFAWSRLSESNRRPSHYELSARPCDHRNSRVYRVNGPGSMVPSRLFWDLMRPKCGHARAVQNGRDRVGEPDQRRRPGGVVTGFGSDSSRDTTRLCRAGAGTPGSRVFEQGSRRCTSLQASAGETAPRMATIAAAGTATTASGHPRGRPPQMPARPAATRGRQPLQPLHQARPSSPSPTGPAGPAHGQAPSSQ